MKNSHTEPGKKLLTGSRGFTLIEVLVALAIAGLALGSLLAATGMGLGNAGLANRYIEATRRAESHLALIGTSMPLQPGDFAGDDGGGYSWRVRISEPVFHQTQAPEGQPSPAIYTVEVTISWPSGGTTKSVSIRSERAGNGGAPHA